MSKSRIIELDFLRFLAIFLVIIGHIYQSLLEPVGIGLGKPIFLYIYSFHMSLFMLISGFFSLRQIKKNNIRELIRMKGKQLLLPSISWGALIVGYEVIFNKLNGMRGVMLFIFELWFLKCLFLCFVYSYIAYKIYKIHAILSFIFLFVVSHFTSAFGVAHMLPCFILGLMIAEYINFIRKYIKVIICISIIVYATLIGKWHYNYDNYVFFNIFKFIIDFNDKIEIRNMLSGIFSEMYRIFVGISGALSVFALILNNNGLRNNRYIVRLSYYGTITLSIYVIQALVLERVLKSILVFPSSVNPYLFNLLIVPFLSIGVISICVLLNKYIEKSIFMRLFFLGK